MIRSRDKTHLKEIIIEQHVNILLQCANLVEDTLCIVITPENTDGKSPKMPIVLTMSYIIAIRKYIECILCIDNLNYHTLFSKINIY